MQQFNTRITYILLLIGTLIISCKSGKISTNEQAKIDNCKIKVESRTFKFTPITASPSNFRSIPLAPDYFFNIEKSNIHVDLPFFGRAFTAPMDPTEGGYKFSSANFEYETISIKNDTQQIKIITKDLRNSVTIYLNIGNTGYTSLIIQDNNREPITFYGYIEGI